LRAHSDVVDGNLWDVAHAKAIRWAVGELSAQDAEDAVGRALAEAPPPYAREVLSMLRLGLDGAAARRLLEHAREDYGMRPTHAGVSGLRRPARRRPGSTAFKGTSAMGRPVGMPVDGTTSVVAGYRSPFEAAAQPGVLLWIGGTLAPRFHAA
jgi:hypothetical protein